MLIAFSALRSLCTRAPSFSLGCTLYYHDMNITMESFACAKSTVSTFVWLKSCWFVNQTRISVVWTMRITCAALHWRYNRAALWLFSIANLHLSWPWVRRSQTSCLNLKWKISLSIGMGIRITSPGVWWLIRSGFRLSTRCCGRWRAASGLRSARSGTSTRPKPDTGWTHWSTWGAESSMWLLDERSSRR